ncbi:hypothetical protein BCY86_04280 [Pajaroellobacter abortibovis]|uniref:Uncharacterized protein n=1 Tax=Pajaroellobacter abortibovis TaxID=1882918 RepID=A0A1L6MWS1_9BACT|nr:hypothetical protein BCY86_04280 [Pajaroellobacter abortibovis]
MLADPAETEVGIMVIMVKMKPAEKKGERAWDRRIFFFILLLYYSFLIRIEKLTEKREHEKSGSN